MKIELCIGALAVGLWLTACGGGGVSAPVTPPPAPTTQWTLVSASAAELTSYLRQALGPNSVRYLSHVWATNAEVALGGAPVAAVAPDGAAPVFSQTTLQEAGVDEADVIKTDGSQVFSLDPLPGTDADRRLLRRQTLNAASANLTPVDSLKLPFSADVQGKGLYLDTQRQQAVVIAEGAMSSPMHDAWFAPTMWNRGVTEVILADTTGATQMQLRRRLRFSAQLIGSRRVGSSLYLVLRSYPQVPGLDPTWPTEKTAANQALIDAVQVSQLLPTLSVDGGKEQPLVQADACFTQASNAVPSADIITVVGIDLAASGHLHSARCFAGATEAFYLSTQSLYLATTRSPYSYSGAVPEYTGQTSTDIHKFALDGLSISYRGSGNVAGHLGFDQNRKSFRMGEHQGALRVITQTASSWVGWLPVVAQPQAAEAPESPGHLSILQESAGELKVVGELPNARRPEALGKAGEQLYATRFVGARAYLVTYRLTDPLYVLDLADPVDPKVAGELQVSGYSDYLFPLSDTLLLGVGKDAVSDATSGDGRFAWYQGVKLSLIDVSNPAKPVEDARSIVGQRGTDATVLHDHHGIALQTVGNTLRVGLPVRLHDTKPTFATGAASGTYDFTRTELQRFEVNLSTQTLNAKLPLGASDPSQRDILFDRALLWNDQVHYYQGSGWQSALW